ncbi:MAG: hypothetical protein QJR02_11350 [Sinobacteraceae bacterium]|nr:hypothetical protein [Nevskiaceae bacterium]
MKLDTLLKKRQAIEEQIRKEQAAEKRRREVAALIERAGALWWSDAAIMDALARYTPVEEAR